MDWDSELPGEAPDGGRKEFVVLPDGDYWFLVKRLEQGTAMSDGAPMASVGMLVKDEKNNTSWVTERIKIDTSCVWKLVQFFESVGLKKPGVPFRMDWSSVVGRCGRVKLKTSKQTAGAHAGENRNEVASYLPVGDSDEPPAWCLPKTDDDVF